MNSRIKWTIVGMASVLAMVAAIFVVAPAVSARGNVGAPVHQATTNHTITVSGHGETQVTPDQATLSVGVQTKGLDAQSTLSSNSTKLTAVIAAIEGQGIPQNHIQTTGLSIWYDQDHTAYMVSHDLTVRLDRVDNVGAVLDAAVQAGADSSWGVNFGVKDPSTARSQALQAAIADARKRADSMAAALGVSVSGVGAASEATYNVTPPEYAKSAAPAAPTPVQPGQETVTADVNVVYTFG